MSDSSGNSFGEALENMTTNSKKAVSGTIADFTKSAANQVKGGGNSNLSGSFTPSQTPQPGNPNAAPNLSGGDLFSPDMLAGKQKQSGAQLPNGQKPLTKLGQQALESPQTKTSEEMAKIQQIEAELRSLHQQYYQDFLAKAEGRDKKTQVDKQEKQQEEQKEEMQDLQKKEEKKVADDQSLKRAQQNVENKGGGIG